IYSNFNNYTVPGPAEFSCSGSGNGGGSSPSQPTTLKTSTVVATSTKAATTTAVVATSTKAATTTAAGSQPTSPSGCSVAKWGQCGGNGYSGCTSCASGSSCKAQNDYYSQCL
ncbi:hypothetical protein N0V85_008844, partial [Neurospora sp. IMI 360204]